MSTRGVIAFALDTAHPDKWEGRYHHSDSYPSGLGSALWGLFRNTFNRDIKAMHKYLYKDHPAGWSMIHARAVDFSLPPGYISDPNKFYEQDAEGNSDYTRPIPRGPRCFCHGDRHEKADRRTNTQDTSDLEWAYVLTDRVYTVTMRVLMAVQTGRKDADGYRIGKWEQVADIDIAEAEPDWDIVECGEQFETCGHTAETHFPELRGTTMERLGTGAFLGREKLTLDNAFAVEIDGHRYTLTGSGSAATDGRGANVWVSSVRPDVTDTGAAVTAIPHRYRQFVTYFGDRFKIYDDGSFNVVTRQRTGKGERPYRGVNHLYPPTMKEPGRLLAELANKLAPTSQGTSEPLVPATSRLTKMMCRGRHFRNDE